ncbi:MAG: hypothetical protein JST63_17070 [Bacteroidetes bacterium]|nr:hypothetical protein [Bacteroidota bacterium]
MEDNTLTHNITEPRKKDFAWSWVTSSRFLFYMQVVAFAAFLIGGSYALYQHRYKGKPKVMVPDNTLYTPKYK